MTEEQRIQAYIERTDVPTPKPPPKPTREEIFKLSVGNEPRRSKKEQLRAETKEKVKSARVHPGFAPFPNSYNGYSHGFLTGDTDNNFCGQELHGH